MTQVMHEKNPNGGYLNPSKYGGHFGKQEFTVQFLQELLQKAQANPKGVAYTETKISAEKMNQKGEPYIRITAKHYDDSWKTNAPAPVQQQPVQQQYAQAPAPIQQQPAQQQVVADEIPF